jgi:hypothetical protein
MPSPLTQLCRDVVILNMILRELSDINIDCNPKGTPNPRGTLSNRRSHPSFQLYSSDPTIKEEPRGFPQRKVCLLLGKFNNRTAIPGFPTPQNCHALGHQQHHCHIEWYGLTLRCGQASFLWNRPEHELTWCSVQQFLGFASFSVINRICRHLRSAVLQQLQRVCVESADPQTARIALHQKERSRLATATVLDPPAALPHPISVALFPLLPGQAQLAA